MAAPRLTCLNSAAKARAHNGLTMETYTTEMAARFREDLMRRAAELDRILRHDADEVREDTAHEVGDFKDSAVEESLATIDNQQSAHAAAEMARVQSALRRLADGSYGECIDCGDPIDLRRLTALPATAYCASCQTVHEQGRERH